MNREGATWLRCTVAGGGAVSAREAAIAAADELLAVELAQADQEATWDTRRDARKEARKRHARTLRTINRKHPLAQLMAADETPAPAGTEGWPVRWIQCDRTDPHPIHAPGCPGTGCPGVELAVPDARPAAVADQAGETTPAAMYETAARAFMANVPSTRHNHWDETMCWERDHPPFRRAVDRVWRDGRAPLLADIARLRDLLRDVRTYGSVPDSIADRITMEVGSG